MHLSWMLLLLISNTHYPLVNLAFFSTATVGLQCLILVAFSAVFSPVNSPTKAMSSLTFIPPSISEQKWATVGPLYVVSDF